MNDHPINLLVRFLLEITLLFIFANWGWRAFEEVNKYLMAIGLPLGVAIVWGVFRVEGDPGKAIVAIPGWLRLMYELLVFASAAFFLFRMNQDKWSYIFIFVSTIHYLASYDRIVWLLKK
jgi:hypothetical protein